MSYTLRRISTEGVELNLNLGNGYTVVHKDHAPERFKEDFKLFFNATYVDCEIDSESVYAFVSTECGKSVYPLYKGQKAYIMLPDGSTFSNVTFKY